MKDIPFAKPNPAKGSSDNPPDQHWKIKRIIGFILLAVILANIVLYISGMIIYNQVPYLAGETAKSSVNTSEQVLWGYFYATGQGRIEYLDDPPTEFRNAKWTVLSREAIGEPRGFFGKNKKDLTRDYGRMNVNIRVPDVQVTQRTSLRLQVVTSGYVARKVSDYQYDLDLVEMRSVPITIVVVPDNLEWFVHQDDYMPLSIMGIFFVFGVLLKKRK
jgi:hypothetical protein